MVRDIGSSENIWCHTFHFIHHRNIPILGSTRGCKSPKCTFSFIHDKHNKILTSCYTCTIFCLEQPPCFHFRQKKGRNLMYETLHLYTLQQCTHTCTCMCTCTGTMNVYKLFAMRWHYIGWPISSVIDEWNYSFHCITVLIHETSSRLDARTW